MAKRARSTDGEDITSLTNPFHAGPTGPFPLESIDSIELKDHPYIFLGDIHPWGCDLCDLEDRNEDPTWLCNSADTQTHPRFVISPKAEIRTEIDKWFMKLIIATSRAKSLTGELRRAEYVLEVIEYAHKMTGDPLYQEWVTSANGIATSPVRKITYEDIKADNSFGVTGAWVLETVKKKFPGEDPADILRTLGSGSWVLYLSNPKRWGVGTCFSLHNHLENLTSDRHYVIIPVFLDGNH